MRNGEQKTMIELIEAYKRHPVLWNRCDKNYRKNDIRAKAYEVLFEIYKTVYVDHDIKDMKQRVENMRTAWAREKKKVEESRIKRENPVHKPKLWYYRYLNFLSQTPPHDSTVADDDDTEADLNDTVADGDDTEYNTLVLESSPHYESDEDYETEEKRPKYMTAADIKSKIENSELAVNYDPLERPDISREESEAFGRMIGLQLHDLDKFQRTVAQKLISDVIFYARLNKLSSHSHLSEI